MTERRGSKGSSFSPSGQREEVLPADVQTLQTLQTLQTVQTVQTAASCLFFLAIGPQTLPLFRRRFSPTACAREWSYRLRFLRAFTGKTVLVCASAPLCRRLQTAASGLYFRTLDKISGKCSPGLYVCGRLQRLQRLQGGIG